MALKLCFGPILEVFSWPSSFALGLYLKYFHGPRRCTPRAAGVASSTQIWPEWPNTAPDPQVVFLCACSQASCTMASAEQMDLLRAEARHCDLHSFVGRLGTASVCCHHPVCWAQHHAACGAVTQWASRFMVGLFFITMNARF
jgi:hypothetical protein